MIKANGSIVIQQIMSSDKIRKPTKVEANEGELLCHDATESIRMSRHHYPRCLRGIDVFERVDQLLHNSMRPLGRLRCLHSM